MTTGSPAAIRIRSAVTALTALGLVACGPREPQSDAERLARGRELVQQMGAHLAGVTQASVTTTEVRDIVRVSGAKNTVPITGEYAFRRPDRFHVKLTGGRGLEAWYDGKGVTVAIPQEKVFAQAPMPETIDRTLDALAERYDLPLPIGDLFNSAPQNAMLSDTTTGGYAGTENVGDTPCYHLAFRDIGVNWEIWLPVQGAPLPKRLKVEQTKRKGQPVTDVTFAAWNVAPQLTDATFAASVPSDFEGIAILQKAAAVKKAAPDAAPPVK